MIILDTNVISELMRPEPNKMVVRWVGAQRAQSLFTTAITPAEILLGVSLLPKGKRRDKLETLVVEMFEADFKGRILAFDSVATLDFAQIVAARRRSGHPIAHADAQIAAIARCHGAVVATRNVTDFDGCGISVQNPWKR